MKALLQKLFYASTALLGLFILAYTIWLYANWQIPGFHALFAVEMGVLAVLAFSFLFNDSTEDWPLSIRYVRPATLPLREHRKQWKPLEQAAA